MPTKQTTHKHHFKKGTKIVHAGIINDLDRHEAEFQSKPGWSKGKVAVEAAHLGAEQSKPGRRKGHIKQAGDRIISESAFIWEPEQNKQGKPLRKK